MEKKAFKGMNRKRKIRKTYHFLDVISVCKTSFVAFFLHPLFFLSFYVCVCRHRKWFVCFSFFPRYLTRNLDSERNPFFSFAWFRVCNVKIWNWQDIGHFSVFHCHKIRPFVRSNLLNCEITQLMFACVGTDAVNSVKTSICIRIANL